LISAEIRAEKKNFKSRKKQIYDKENKLKAGPINFKS